MNTMTGRALSVFVGRDGTVMFRLRHSEWDMVVSGAAPMAHWIKVDCSNVQRSGAGARGLVLSV